MAADSIIEPLNPFKHILHGVLSCSIAPMMHEFRFQRVEETFHYGIVQNVYRHFYICVPLQSVCVYGFSLITLKNA